MPNALAQGASYLQVWNASPIEFFNLPDILPFAKFRILPSAILHKFKIGGAKNDQAVMPFGKFLELWISPPKEMLAVEKRC